MALFRCRKEVSPLGIGVCASGKEVSASRKEVSALGKELSAKKKSSFALANSVSPNRWQIRGIEDLRLECFGKDRSVRYELHERKR
jgi:hypothetical protein